MLAVRQKQPKSVENLSKISRKSTEGCTNEFLRVCEELQQPRLERALMRGTGTDFTMILSGESGHNKTVQRLTEKGGK